MTLGIVAIVDHEVHLAIGQGNNNSATTKTVAKHNP
jgi:hypothetical protein